MAAHPVNGDERDEIAAAVAAHGELGARYDSAIAEGLIERIGDEIDKRVEARLRGQQSAFAAPVPSPVPGPGPEPSRPADAAPRRNYGVTGMFLGLGSMGIGVGATAVVVTHHVDTGAAVFMIIVIWWAIAMVNFAHSRRR